MNAYVILAVATGGLAGAPARYAVDRFTRSEMPFDTLMVNVSGSSIFGLLTGLHLAHQLGPVPLALLGTGFCGAFTTFSSFTFETLQLLEEHSWRHGAANVVLSVLLGLAAAGAGLAVGLAL